MRRIYLESLFGLLACFIGSIVLYELSVYQLNTDYEYLLEDYEAQAYQQLLDNIARHQGLDSAHDAMQEFAQTERSKITIHSGKPGAPDEVITYFNLNPEHTIFYDEERLLWFRLSIGDNIYQYTSDEEALVHQKVELEDNLAWLFLLGGFILYCFGYLIIILRRIQPLEQATLAFAEGDLSSRAETKSSKALGTLNRSFNLMADKISHLLESNRSLTNAVAHELRTPVFRIQWQAELLKETALDNEQLTAVSSIVEDTEEMEQMIDELLHFARLESGRFELQPESIALDDFLPHSLSRWQKESPLTITLIMPEHGKVSLFADKRLLGRALDNLVRNAFKFADSQVQVQLLAGSREITLEVHDDGPGVAPEYREHLFDPFYVADKARNKGKSGHGLGLSIVKKICEQHGATVAVDSSPELRGARFTIRFPLDKPVEN
jgi:two-component system sensor histidine kinase RstB